MDYTQIRARPINRPIEFKEINPEDFHDDYTIDNENKFVITPDENGYIGEQLRTVIDLNVKNTVVINAGVGQGKSNECINIAIDYINQTDEDGKNKYVVIFIAPFINLINQYEKRLLRKGIPPKNIFNYTNLTSNTEVDIDVISEVPLHIVTINTFIGNHGEDGFIQSGIKRHYLHEIIQHCEKTRKKVVFIFDEIHESIHNFKEKFIFNLWKWYHVLHKSFILSATYSESSKVVIKYLAELTNDKIQIIETERIKIESKQSRLHLCLNNQFIYTGDDERIAFLIEEECKRGKNIHILTFSETLAKKIALPEELPDGQKVYSKIGKILMRYFREINLCTGDSKISFNENKCNVGTTFKTGISIENGNTSFFIITPHLGAYEAKYNKHFGVFSDGTNSIIQAIARVRTGDNTDIFVIMPTPKKLIESSTENVFEDNYLIWTTNVPDFRLLRKNELAKYYSLSSQKNELHKFFGGVICDFAEIGIQYFNMRFMNEKGGRSKTKPRLLFTEESQFILEDGDSFLSSSYEIFGSDISAYITWAAYNNQFENATLKSVYCEEEILLREGQIVEGLFKIFFKKFGMPYNIEFIAEKTLYDEFYTYVTASLKVKVLTKTKRKIPAIKSSLVKIGIITIVQHLKRENEKFNKNIYPIGKTTRRGRVRIAHDYFITKEMYLGAAISNSINSLVLHNQLERVEKAKVDGYRQLYSLGNSLKKIIVFKDNRGKPFIPKKGFFTNINAIPSDLIIGLFSAIKNIRANDPFINDDTFSFCQWADKVSINKLLEDDTLKKDTAGRIIDEIRKLYFEAETLANTSARVLTNELNQEYKSTSKPYKVSKEISFEDIKAVNVIYTTKSPLLESDVSEDILIALNEENPEN